MFQVGDIISWADGMIIAEVLTIESRCRAKLRKVGGSGTAFRVGHVYITNILDDYTIVSKHPAIQTQFLGGLNEFL